MTNKHLLLLLTLAAFWGGSFSFIRIAAPEFGPTPLMAVRVMIASLVLVVILLWKQGFSELFSDYKKLLLVLFSGVINQAIPFSLFAYAGLELSASITSVVNSATPIWSAIIAWFWFRVSLSWGQQLGLLISFLGVAVIASEGFVAQGNSNQHVVSIVAVLVATLFYGVSANFIKRYLSGVSALSIAAGSMIGASMVLVPFAFYYWPTESVSEASWYSAVILGIFCTAGSYLIFFNLLKEVGPTNTVSVTYLVPIFGVFWGVTFLDEAFSLFSILGSMAVLVGVLLVTNIISLNMFTKTEKTG